MRGFFGIFHRAADEAGKNLSGDAKSPFILDPEHVERETPLISRSASMDSLADAVDLSSLRNASP